MESTKLIRGCLEKIRHLQRGLRGLEQDGRRAAREALDFAGHMGLIAVACVCGQVCEAPPTACATSKMQHTLKSENGLKGFRAVSHRRRKTTLELAAADTNPATKLPYPPMRMASQPLDGCVDYRVAGCRICQETEQQVFK